MTQSEFREWLADLRRKSPQLGEWVAALPSDTLRDWYESVFESIELRWAKAVNLEIMTGDHDLSGYNRDKLLPTMIKRSQELRYQHSRTRELRTNDMSGAQKAVASDPVMRPAMAYVADAVKEFRLANGIELTKPMPDDLWDALRERCNHAAGEACERFDTEIEDEHKQPRFKCLRCRDSGLVSSYGHPNTVGHCDCGTGKATGGRIWRSGRQLGQSMKEPEDNPFQQALEDSL